LKKKDNINTVFSKNRATRTGDDTPMATGESIIRHDAAAKVTGRAEYTQDLYRPGMLTAKYLRSTIAHGRVTDIDISAARAFPGVAAVFTFRDVPRHPFATAGHPLSLDPAHRDVADRLLLTQTIRYMGDEIAVVVADNELIAEKALQLIRVEYTSWPVLIDPADILDPEARQIHEGASNVMGEHGWGFGADIESEMGRADFVLENRFETAMVQHCHLENHVVFAYMDDLDRIVIHSSTQIPHIVRRIVGDALDFPLSRIRVIKPHIGGGFGNKQDVIFEPMAAFLTRQLNGRPVAIHMTREEGMINTRVRHPFHITVKTGVMTDGTLAARDVDAVAVTGAYASHGHSVAEAGGGKMGCLYPRTATRYHARTLYANLPAAGAMRAYGSPQIMYALECATEDAARAVHMDSVAFRLKNIVRRGDIDPLSGEKISSCGLAECLIRGRDMIGWEAKKKAYADCKTGPVRRGLGVACFSYASGTYPACTEIASARLILNQDGTVHVMAGAVEIGQGSDTVIAQMAAHTLGISHERIRVIQVQDTDVTPFDTGAYASRQAYVSSNAVFRASVKLKERILDHAARMTGKHRDLLDIDADHIVTADTRIPVMDLKTLALDTCYHKTRGGHLTAEVSHKTTSAAPVFGCTFADIEVDIPLCTITIRQILNVHDSGMILNPAQARGQVHGGAAMGIGAALSEEFLIDPDTGRVFNANLLDYKVPTFMDTPVIRAAFVETREPSSGHGNKALGEPPVIPPAPAIRNALLDATGVAVNRLPITPKVLFEAFTRHGLIQKRGTRHV
jgi:xanthine dehydrogenase molybdenum-binding subunit